MNTKIIVLLITVAVISAGGLVAIKGTQKPQIENQNQANISHSHAVEVKKVKENQPSQAAEAAVPETGSVLPDIVEPAQTQEDNTVISVVFDPVVKPDIIKDWTAPGPYDQIMHLIINADGTYQEYEAWDGGTSYKNHGKWTWESNASAIDLVDDEEPSNNSKINIVNGKLEGFQ
jgi:hypothetical protein